MTPDVAPARVRVGCVQYLNARPLIDDWPGAVVFDHPSALCRQLSAGDLDVALVSSFEFLREPEYLAVAGIAIASDGPVFSVFVASRGPFEQLRAIELDPASLTSVNLLTCLLGERGMQVEYRSPRADLPSRHVGRLLIGDQAIRFRRKHGDDFVFTDLGELWKSATGLPFVYALWLIRPGVHETYTIADSLRAVRDANVQRLAALASRVEEFEPEFCRFYWERCLRFDFGERERAGLLEWRTLCQKHRLLPPRNAALNLI